MNMEERITQKNLENLVARINKMMNAPEAAWTKHENGKYTSNDGHYCLDYAYGGVKLARMSGSAGGQDDISRTGFVSKRELYEWMQAFLEGIWQTKKTFIEPLE